MIKVEAKQVNKTLVFPESFLLGQWFKSEQDFIKALEFQFKVFSIPKNMMSVTKRVSDNPDRDIIVVCN